VILRFSVLTTIQKPTPSVYALVRMGNQFDMSLLVVGDRKSPICEWPKGSEFFSLARQKESSFRLGKLLPVDHYSRKNLGYLEAISRGATIIFDTDDDNAPLSHWQPRGIRVEVRPLRYNGWINVYRWFSPGLIWPRGIPLENLQECQKVQIDTGSVEIKECPVQQGLVNGSPDVDAVWRLILGEEFNFDEATTIWLAPGGWCPFNSQSTWWFEKAFPLLYLPSFVSFRMTDIWRSFVAQRCLWEIGYGVAFHGPESLQRRNMHNLRCDFEEEIPGYLYNNRIISILEKVQLSGRTEDNMHHCYEALASAGIVPQQEIPLVEAWIEDFQAYNANSPRLA
jgi:STELLO glycosyltransferases